MEGEGNPRKRLRDEAHVPDAQIEPTDSNIWSQFASRHFTDEERDVKEMGLMGWLLLCCQPIKNAQDKIHKQGVQQTTKLLVLQCLGVQFGLLYFLGQQIVNAQHDDSIENQKAPPFLLVILAIYLHVLVCMGGIAEKSKPFFTLTSKKSDAGMVYVTLGLVTAFLIPLITLLCGSLFLCDADTITDLVLNSCAMSFIPQIDGWLVQFECHALGVDELKIFLKPFPQHTAWRMKCKRIVPLVMTGVLYWIGGSGHWLQL